MRYHAAHIETYFAQEWQRDVFEQALFDLGFDSIDGQTAYIPSALWETNRSQIEALCGKTQGVMSLRVEPCPDENWNATWEADHPMQELPLGIRIVPHCAFGAGHHETTAMMIEGLINFKSQISNFKFSILDHGTGTGVLAIFAKKLGADKVVAVDIDEKSVENAQENAKLNHVDIDVQHDSAFSFQPSAFSLIMANIHRNILLQYMPDYAASLTDGGELWISGFYEADCAALIAAAEENQLRMLGKKENNTWYMMKFQKDGKR